MQWCFQCARDYLTGETECPECAVPLVGHRPVEEDVLSADGGVLIAYELHEWRPDVRRMVDVALTEQRLLHTWQGASLLVREDDEVDTDVVLDEIETRELPSLRPELARVSYQFDDWAPDQREELSHRLGMEGITHEYDVSGDLVIHEEDEEQVDDLVEAFREELSAEQQPDGTVVLEGVEVTDLLSEVFIGAQRLARNPNDHAAVIASMEAGRRLLEVKRPFGFDAVGWVAIREDVAALTGMLGEEGDDETLAGAAVTLRDRLRPVV